MAHGYSPGTTGYVKECYSKGVSEIRSELRSYWLNSAFVLGHQWTFWDAPHNRLENLEEDEDRIQATVNRMRANLRVIMANLMQRELTFENHPMAYDDASIQAARIGEHVIYDISKAHNWEALRERVLIAALKSGTAAISVDWDAENSETVESLLVLGDFIVEPGATDARKARYWVRRQAFPTDYVWSMFKDHFGDKPPPSDTVAALDPYMHRITGGSLGSDTMVPRTHVYTYYERPNPLCPEGKILVEVNGQIIQHIEEWPFPFKDRLNLVPIIETVVEGRWYGATFLDDVRPLQVALNAVWSNLMEHVRDAGSARLMAPSSAVDLINSLTDRPGEVVEYPDGTTPPGYLAPPQLSAWLRDMPTQFAALIDDIMGVHDVSRGMAPPNIESGLGLSILAENDSSPTGRLIKEMAGAFTEVSQLVLMIIEKQVKGYRTSTVMHGTSPIRFRWKGSDINGQTNIGVPLEAVVPISRAAQIARADKMMEMGLITTAAEYAAIANLPGQQDIVEITNPDIAKARRENAAFILGEVPLPADFDDHEAHIKEHNVLRKSPQYELMNDDEKEVVDLHVQAHETMAAEEAGTSATDAEMGPAMALAANADGSQGDPGLAPEIAVEDLPEPPEVSDNPAVDPSSMVNEMLSQLPQ